MGYSFISSEWYQRAEKHFLSGNYLAAAQIYEEAIDAEPEIKSHYWYLGLIFLLQGQDVEAQTTWLMAMVEGEAEKTTVWSQELATILHTEAARREKLEEYAIAEKIRLNIKEIIPQDIHNLLHLLMLAVELNTYTGEELEEFGVIEILASEPQPEIDLTLLIVTLKTILKHAPKEKSSIKLLETAVTYFQDNLVDLLNIVVPAAVEVAYSHMRARIGAEILEIYLKLDPENTECLGHIAGFYQNCNEYDKGIEAAKKLYSLSKTTAEKVFANRQVLRGLMTAGGYWEESCEVNQRQQDLLAELFKEYPTDIPPINVVRLFSSNFFAFYIEDNPRKQREIQNKLLQLCHDNSLNFGKEQIEKYIQGHLTRKKQAIPNKKLKIGYISHCFRSHSVGWLARWLFVHHDREKFEIYAYFVSVNTIDDLLHYWYEEQADKVYKSNNVWELTEQIYQDEIDILIDLDSITLDTTSEVVACKPAPIQLTWLGWDAPGTPTVDYFIADPYVLPDTAQEYYREKIWRLPNTYIAVDGFEVGVPKLRREQLDISPDAIVYLCGQRGFKRHPDITRLQLRIIKAVPNSYFLIKGISDEESIQQFFYKLAEEEGVDISRLRFLPGVPTEETHRSNLGIVDVVLDTYPYNGATTTLETLWMCIPMVTKVGEQFAARNSYTMMVNAGITEGIAWTDEEYLDWGIRLGTDEALRKEIAWKLKKSRQTAPLWNGKQFTRDMENAYQQMWQKYLES